MWLNKKKMLYLHVIDQLIRLILFSFHLYRYKIFKGKNATLATFGVGLCSFDDTENCLVFVNLLDNAVLPVPTCLPDGTLVWPQCEYLRSCTNKHDLVTLHFNLHFPVERPSYEYVEQVWKFAIKIRWNHLNEGQFLFCWKFYRLVRI